MEKNLNATEEKNDVILMNEVIDEDTVNEACVEEDFNDELNDIDTQADFDDELNEVDDEIIKKNGKELFKAIGKYLTTAA